MKFILYSLNYAPELTGIGKYNGELAPFLAEQGITTHVITAPPYYPEWKLHPGYTNGWSTVSAAPNLIVYRCPLYVPKRVSTIKRLLHLFSFAISSAVTLFSMLSKKPDFVFVIQPTLFCTPAALLFCKVTGAKSLLHIQDFEVDAMFGLGMAGKDGFVKSIIRKTESWLLRRFDCVSSISYSMLDNARKKGVDSNKLLFFPNWADTQFVTPDVDGTAIKAELGFASHEKIVLYSGNIGQKQGLEVVIEAANSFKNAPDVRFVIIGSGAYKATLQSLATQQGLTNISFLPLQPWEKVPYILAMADVHLVVQKRGAADAVLPSKLTNILSAGGHALVTAEANTELGLLANRYPGIYTLVEPESSAAFISALQSLLAQDLTSTNNVARDYAVENLARDKVINRFVQDLHNLK